jgi:hypothetical protein
MGDSRNPQRRTLARATRQVAWPALLLLAAGQAAAAAQADAQVPDAIQRRIEDRFADRFVYPDTTDWVFTSMEPYPGGSKVVCGTVNYQNAMRRYVGAKHFYAILDDTSIPTIGIDMDENEDRTGEGAFKMKTLCHLP